VKFPFAFVALVIIFSASRNFAESGSAASAARYEVSRDAIFKTVLGALNQNGQEGSATFSPADLQLPQGLTSKEKYPALEVAGVQWNAFAHEWQVSMRCRERSSCAGFLVLLAQKQHSATNAQKVFGDFHLSHRTFSTGETKRPDSPLIVQSGRPATLVMQSADARITLPVVCLQGGSLNQVIVARDPETKQILRAKVIGPARLQASF
jgi:hypothetical protein